MASGSAAGPERHKKSRVPFSAPIQAGDWVLAAPDYDPYGEPVPRQVEEIFENYLPTLDLHVNGRIIRTTAEHPFWVLGRGWVDANRLEDGEELRAHDGRWLKVEGIEGAIPAAPVYNMCVGEYHTYFVGHQVWGFAVWSHNIGCGPKGSNSGGSNASNNPLKAATDRGMRTIRGRSAPDEMVEVIKKLGRPMSREQIGDVIHKAKDKMNIGAAEDVVFDRSGGMWDSRTGEFIGKLWDAL
jgi:hypothetical protein